MALGSSFLTRLSGGPLAAQDGEYTSEVLDFAKSLALSGVRGSIPFQSRMRGC